MIRAVAATTHTDARRVALGALFDHAALFPPASLGIAEALAEDARVRAGADAWLVRRFVCPASRLAELGPVELPLSVVADVGPGEWLDDPRVQAVEVPPDRDPGPYAAADKEVFVERPLDDLDWLEDVRERRLFAKVRCGGPAVPTVERLAAFVRRCRALGLPFKATAGLHHPLRGDEEHGFLNLLAAAAFGDEAPALAERDPAAFRLDRAAFGWRDEVADAAAVGRVRRELLLGIGSCSIREPVDDLKLLGLLT